MNSYKNTNNESFKNEIYLKPSKKSKYEITNKTISPKRKFPEENSVLTKKSRNYIPPQIKFYFSNINLEGICLIMF